MTDIVEVLRVYAPHLPSSSGTCAQAMMEAADEIERLRDVVRELEAVIGIMFGIGPDAKIPNTVRSPLGVDIKLGDIMRRAAQERLPRSDRPGTGWGKAKDGGS